MNSSFRKHFLDNINNTSNNTTSNQLTKITYKDIINESNILSVKHLIDELFQSQISVISIDLEQLVYNVDEFATMCKNYMSSAGKRSNSSQLYT